MRYDMNYDDSANLLKKFVQTGLLKFTDI